jgi:hypothetical protein
MLQASYGRLRSTIPEFVHSKSWNLSACRLEPEINLIHRYKYTRDEYFIKDGNTFRDFNASARQEQYGDFNKRAVFFRIPNLLRMREILRAFSLLVMNSDKM